MKDGRDANGIGKVIPPLANKLVELPAPRNQIFIKTIPPNIGRHALEAVNIKFCLVAEQQSYGGSILSVLVLTVTTWV